MGSVGASGFIKAAHAVAAPPVTKSAPAVAGQSGFGIGLSESGCFKSGSFSPKTLSAFRIAPSGAPKLFESGSCLALPISGSCLQPVPGGVYVPWPSSSRKTCLGIGGGGYVTLLYMSWYVTLLYMSYVISKCHLLARATQLEILIWILVWFSGSVRDGEEREVA